MVKIRLCLDAQCGEMELREFPVVLGRSLEADITLEDRWASRRHCRFNLVDGQLLVEDLASKHGTYVNGRRIRQAVLRPGDQLTIGLTLIELCETAGERSLVGQRADRASA